MHRYEFLLLLENTAFYILTFVIAMQVCEIDIYILYRYYDFMKFLWIYLKYISFYAILFLYVYAIFAILWWLS